MPSPFIARDSFARKARQEGYLARSAYKLKSILERFTIIRSGNVVLDIGAAPGSWLQVISEIIGSRGTVIGIDIQPITFQAKNVITVQVDAQSPDIHQHIAPYGPYDAITSDAAPKTTGIKIHDQTRSLELAEQALLLSQDHLRKGGALVTKLFQSSDTTLLLRHAHKQFRKAVLYKPKASRERSFETFLVCMDKK